MAYAGDRVASSGSNITQWTFSTASVLVLPANNLRTGFSVYNDTNNVICIAYGPVASTSSFTAKIADGGTPWQDQNMTQRPYWGPVSLIGVSGSAIRNPAQITELY